MNKAEDIEQLIYRELPPDRYCYIHNFIVEKDKEIERLNNIINEIEKNIKAMDFIVFDGTGRIYIQRSTILDKLQELKGDSSNE